MGKMTTEEITVLMILLVALSLWVAPLTNKHPFLQYDTNNTNTNEKAEEKGHFVYIVEQFCK